MLPHNPSDLKTILELIGQQGCQSMISDMRHIVNKLTHDLIMAETERDVMILQGGIRVINDLINRYTRPA
jgi:hypothetical protein